MSREEQIIDERIKKMTALRKAGINPFPNKYDVKNISSDLQVKYKSLKPEQVTKDSVRIAGRLMILRDMGKIAFGTIDDGYGRIQIVLQDGETPKEVFDLFKKYIDSGDFVGIEGIVFRTKRGELSIHVKSAKVLTKSILPLPEKWHGIQDDEERLRKRYLDLIINPSVRDMFIRKSKFWQSIRNFLLTRGFLEVETPVLETTPGGAEARPFITKHNALDMPVHLRISPELWLKRLMVSGYPKVFEIGRIFRNEGMDAEHLQDYTQMEFYWAYADYKDGMKLVEEMYKHVAKETFGTLKFKIKDFDIDLGKEWEIYDYVKTIESMTGINVLKTNLREVEDKLKSLGVKYDRQGFNLTRAVDNLWKYCRRKISGPGFLINVPVMMEPLAKRSEKNPEIVERYQIILAGSELGKGFSELNDPIDQAERFEEQAKLREQGDEEAQMTDDDFVEALKQGMPPTTGFGVSERLFSFLEGKPIRETVIFPLMKPQTTATKEEVTKKEIKSSKKEKSPATKKARKK